MLKSIFSKNGYSTKFVDRCIATFFNKLHEKKVIVHTVPKLDLMVVLPFLGTVSWKVKNDLLRTFKKNVPFCNLKIVFKTGQRLSSFFPFKDRFPKSLMSGVRGESKYDFRTVSVQWTLRGWGGQVLDAKDCNCIFHS